MSGAGLLARLAAGRADAFDRVLQNTRFEGFGSAAYGAEAIHALFRGRPTMAEDAVQVTGASAAALIGRDGEGAGFALYADLHDGWVTRLWRLGAGATAPGAPPSTSVPADFDLNQRGGRLAFDAGDHPALAPDYAETVAALGERWLRDAPVEVVGGLERARFLVLRAMSEEDRVAALFRVQGASSQGLAGFYALAVVEPSAQHVVVDAVGAKVALAAPWAPVLRAARESGRTTEPSVSE